MKAALIQMKVLPTPAENLEKAKGLIAQAAGQGCELAILGEMFACPYNNAMFQKYGMPEDSDFVKELAAIAKKHGIYLAAGSIPETDGGKLYNTAFVFDPEGKRIARHRKMHLFDIDVEGGQRYMESEVLTAGEDVTTFETPWGCFGLAICYDMRFPELSRLMALKGAKAILLPAAFNMTTGPAHWEMSIKARALDNQCYFLACSCARDTEASYVAWGNSTVADPWGQVVDKLDENEGILYVELDMAKVEKVRRELPLLKHLRKDLYQLEWIKE